MKHSTFALRIALIGLLFCFPAAAQIVLTDPSITFDTVVTGLATPTTMAFLGSNDFLVLQKNNGQVRRVVNGVLQPTAVLDVPVANSSEEGMLGIAINTESPPKVFLYYTESTADGGTPLGNRIYRYTWNPGNPPDPDAGRLESPQLLRDLPVTPGPNHNGGVLLLGPPEAGLAGDGRPLYAVIGELNRTGQLQNFANGAAPDDTGVIFRLQQDGSAHPNNPFSPYCSVTTTTTCTTTANCPAGQTCITAVASYVAYGVRNSFGLALDPMTGSLWDTENGPSNYDEVNLVTPGFNSGWQRIMGPVSRDAEGTTDLFDMPGPGNQYSDPEFSWLATIAPTGIIFPVGSALGTAYDSVVLVGDSNNGFLYRLPLNAARTGFALSGDLADLVADSAAERDELRIGSGFAGVVDLVLGPDGAVYVVSIGNGTIYRIRAATAPTPSPSPTATSAAATATRTPSRTPTRTSTATFTAVNTATPTSTLVPSATPVSTATSTSTPINTATLTATPTFTPSITATRSSSATPTLTPPPAATFTSTPSTAHIGDLDGSSANLGKNWQASVTIAVHDAGHSPVSGATVSGAWSGGAAAGGSCVTAANGSCSVTSPSVPKKSGSETWTVTGVSASGRVYQPASNHDPDGDSNGTAITVRK